MQTHPSRLTPSVRLALLLGAAVLLWAAVASRSTANTTAGQSRSAQQGVSLVAGPLINVQLNTPYTYKFRIVTNRSYSKAFVGFVLPPACRTSTTTMKLTAHKPATVTLKVTFLNTSAMHERGIQAQVSSSAGSGAQVIAYKVFHLTPAPTDPPPAQCTKWIGPSKTGV